MEEMRVERFVRHFKTMVGQEGSFAFFLGAGASISSGIPGAKDLVLQWLRKLHREHTGNSENFDDWVTEALPNYDPKNPAASYARVMRNLFLQPSQRQREIERVVRGHDPAFGYAVLSQLITNPDFGARCNLVLTTNFDDLVADALYLYTQEKPLVIVHESLAAFAESGLARPLVIKLHGDALLAPKNLEEETAGFDSKIEQVLIEQLRMRGLIFVGYGGNDKSLVSFLENLPTDALKWGVYWINDQVPDNLFGRWFEKQEQAVWVNHLDFDELMLLVREEFGLAHPRQDRFEKLIRTYQDTFSALSKSIDKKPEDKTTNVLKAAASKATEQVDDSWSVRLAAQKYEDSDRDKADRIYQEGLRKFPHSADLMRTYAHFLSKDRGDPDRAEEIYRRAIEVDPNDTFTLASYASFLANQRNDLDQAEAFYHRAIKADPNDAFTLDGYAVFLSNHRNDLDQAEAFYRRAIEVDPNHALNLDSYANFLADHRNDLDQAEAFYRRAIEADPNRAFILGRYAIFLSDHRNDLDQAEEFFRRAIEADPNHHFILGRYASFLADQRNDLDQAEEFYRRAIDADPNDAMNLSRYAILLSDHRNDLDQAEEFFRRAIEADPNHAFILGTYARFLRDDRQDLDQAEEFFRRANETYPNKATNLGN